MSERRPRKEAKKEKELEFQAELRNHNRKFSLPYSGIWYHL